jgi:aryl-alcohol dehydrogenase-like predicted oxidoreductase
VDRAERIKEIVPDGMTMPELALRFILHHPAVSTVIPGMRSIRNVRANLAASEPNPNGAELTADLLAALRGHRWDREPTWWSQ